MNPLPFLAWLALTSSLATVRAAEQPWFQRCLVGVEIGPTGAQFGYSDPNDARYCARMDGRQMVRQAASAHSEYVVVWARDGDYAYYNSKLLPKAPGLGARDPLGEAVEEGRARRLPIIAYCVVQQGGHFLKAHPEWEMRGPDGRPIGRFCLNSGYLQAMKDIVAEQLAYGIAGFHIDMLDQGFGPPYGCWCEACRREFQARFGRPMPKGATWDEDWDRMLEFRYASSERFEKALCAHAKSLSPVTTVDFNYHGNPPFSFEVGQRPVQHAGNSDFVTGETGMWGFGALTVGLNAEFYRAATPGLPVQVAISRDARVYHNQTIRPLADLRWELFALLAHGTFVTVVDKMGFDGWLDPVCYQRLGLAFEEARAKRGQFGQRPLREVGLYFSSRTRDWMGRENPAEYYQSFQGAHKAMVYEHIPWGVILEENVTLETLKQFAVVMLPNVGILSDREIDLLRRYVEAGGQLLVTGLTGCFDRLGRLQEKSSIESLTGARFVRKLDSLDNWVRFSSTEVAASGTAPSFSPDGRTIQQAAGRAISPQAFHRGIPADWPFLVKGPAGVFTSSAATPVGELLKPYRTTRQLEGKEGTGWPLNAEAPVGPAVLLNALGKGRVLTFCGSPDYATASEHHIVEARKFLVNAVRLLHPSPLIQVLAPVNVEAVVTDDSSNCTLRVHLVAYNTPPQTMPPNNRPYVLPALIEEAPIYRLSVESSRPLKRAEAWNRSTALKHWRHRLEATVNEVHEVLTLHYSL